MSFLTTLKKFGNHIGAYKVHLCPEVKGQASEKGKPLSNVKIERVLNFSDKLFLNRISPQSINITGFPHNIHNLSL